MGPWDLSGNLTPAPVPNEVAILVLKKASRLNCWATLGKEVAGTPTSMHQR